MKVCNLARAKGAEGHRWRDSSEVGIVEIASK